MTYCFPIPRVERIVLLVGALLGAALPVALLFVMQPLAAQSGMTLPELERSTTALRAAFGGMLLLYFGGLYALVTFHRVKEGMRLQIEDDAVRLSQPGWPLLGIGARDLTLRRGEVDRVRVERVQRGTVQRVELEVGAGREHIRVNLAHAHRLDVQAGAVPEPLGAGRASWPEHPLAACVATSPAKHEMPDTPTPWQVLGCSCVHWPRSSAWRSKSRRLRAPPAPTSWTWRSSISWTSPSTAVRSPACSLPQHVMPARPPPTCAPADRVLNAPYAASQAPRVGSIAPVNWATPLSISYITIPSE